MLGFAPLASTALADDGGGLSVIALVTGVEATGQVNAPAASVDANITLIGVEATGQVGTVTVSVTSPQRLLACPPRARQETCLSTRFRSRGLRPPARLEP